MPARRGEFVIVTGNPRGQWARGLARAIRDVITDRWVTRFRHLRRPVTYMVRIVGLQRTERGTIRTRQPFGYHSPYSIIVISANTLRCGSPGSTTAVRGHEREVSLPKVRAIVKMAKCRVVLVDWPYWQEDSLVWPDDYDEDEIHVKRHRLPTNAMRIKRLVESTRGQVIHSRSASDSDLAAKIVSVRATQVAHRVNVRPAEPEPGWGD